MKLKNNYLEKGRDMEVFRNNLKKIDESTSVIPVKCKNIKIFTYDKKDDRFISPFFKDGKFQMYVTQANSLTDKDLLDEAKHLQTLLAINNKFYYVGGNTIRDLGARNKITGEGLYNMTGILERNMYLMKKMKESENEVEIVIRNNGFSSKIVAVPSAKYEHIPQSELNLIIDYIIDNLGKTENENWWISHFETKAIFEMPEKAQEISDMYSLPDVLIPYIIVETSDTGDSSLSVRCYLRRKSSLFLCGQCVKKHVNYKQESFLKQLSSELFPMFLKLPEKLFEFADIDLTKEQAEQAIEDICDSFKNNISKRNVTRLKQAMSLEIVDETYTAYDIAMMFLKLQERLDEKEMSLRAFLENSMKYILDYSFSDLAKTETKDSDDLMLMPS